MPTINKQTHVCECGHRHTVSPRIITINKEMVHSLMVVYRYLLAKGRYDFSRKEVKHLFRSETATARFGDLVYFGGILFKQKKGSWGMNMERAELFLTNRATIAENVTKNPITGEITPSETRLLMRQIKGIKDFLDANGEFVIEYEQNSLAL